MVSKQTFLSLSQSPHSLTQKNWITSFDEMVMVNECEMALIIDEEIRIDNEIEREDKIEWTNLEWNER